MRHLVLSIATMNWTTCVCNLLADRTSICNVQCFTMSQIDHVQLRLKFPKLGHIFHNIPKFHLTPASEITCHPENVRVKKYCLSKSCSLVELVVFLHCMETSGAYRRQVELKLHSSIKRRLDLSRAFVICLLIDVEQWDLSSLLVLDTDWCYKVQKLAILRMELEETLSWLSTLGGAYSSLGERNLHFAQQAGQISLSQLKLSLFFGDPNLIARSFIYICHSLCQQGKRGRAVWFVRRCLYPFLTNLGAKCEPIVKNMYKSLRFRMLFIYKK